MKTAIAILGLASVARALFSQRELRNYEHETVLGRDQLYVLTDLELEEAVMHNGQGNLNSQRSRIVLCYESSEQTDGPKCESWEFMRLDAQADSESEERKCALWEEMESDPEFGSARQEGRHPTKLNAFLESDSEERKRKTGESTEFDAYFDSEKQERAWALKHHSDSDAKLNSGSESWKKEAKHSTETGLDFDPESAQRIANLEALAEKDVYDKSQFSCFFGSLDLGDKTLYLASDGQMRGFVSLNRDQSDPRSSKSRFRAQELIQKQLHCLVTEENNNSERSLTILTSKIRTEINSGVEFEACDFFYRRNNKAGKQEGTPRVGEDSHIQSRLLSTLTIPGYYLGTQVIRAASSTNSLLSLSATKSSDAEISFVDSDEQLKAFYFEVDDDIGPDYDLVTLTGTIEDISQYSFYIISVTSVSDSKTIQFLNDDDYNKIKEITMTGELTTSVTQTEDDDFIVVWADTSIDEDGSYGIAGVSLADHNSSPSTEFRVNTNTTSDQIRPKVTTLVGDGYIVAWQSNLQDGYSYGIYAQKFYNDSTRNGSEFQLSGDGDYSQEDVDIDGLSTSGYVAVWVRDSDSEKRIECRTDSSSIFLVDTNTQEGTESVNPSVTALTNDEFMVAWLNKSPGSDYGTFYIQIFDASANPDGDIITVATDVKLPRIAHMKYGSVGIAWIDNSSNLVSYGLMECTVANCDSCPSSSSTCSTCKSGFYLDGNTCNSCTSPCIECIGSGTDQCTMCPANSLPSANPGSCECISGYYESTSNSFECFACDSSCLECNGSSETDCKECSSEINPSNTEGRCKCPSSQYATSLNSLDCSDCHSSCLECNGPLETDCTSCPGSTRTPTSPNGICECPSGTFEASSSPVTCTACDSSCQECSGDQQDQCTSCKDGRTPTDSPGYCTCPSGTYEHTMNPLNCVDCDPECTECTQPHRCTACKSGLVLDDGVCKCPTGYLLMHTDLQCYACPDNCEECYCEGCENGYNSNELICTSCLHGYFLSAGKCDVACSDNCAECVKQDLCTQCNQTFVLNSSGSCECPDENYTITDGECVHTPLSYDIEDRGDYYLITFSQNLRTDLTAKNMICEFLPSNITFSFHVEPNLDSNRRLENAGSQYRLTIDAEIIPEGTTGISIEFTDIVSVSGNTIQGSNLKLTLEAEKKSLEQKMDSSSNEKELLENISVRSVAYVTVFVGTAVSLVTALISRNGGYLWTFVNTIYLIYYMPLQNIGMTTSMKSFCKHLNIYYLGVSEIPLDIYDSEDSPEGWYEHDLETTNLIDNLKYSLFGALLGGVLLVTVLVLRRYKGSTEFIEHRIIDMKWNYFYRLWILSFINVLVAGVLSTGNMDNDGAEEYFGLTVMILCLGFIVFLLVYTYRKLKILENRNENEYNYNSFFCEFKSEGGFLRMLYYPLFFIRRYIYILGLYYMEEYPLVQVLTNASFSVATVSYLIILKPFRDDHLNLLNTIFEIVLSFMFAFSSALLLDLSNDSRDSLEVVLLTLVITILEIAIGMMVFRIYKVCSSYMKVRCVIPSNEVISGENGNCEKDLQESKVLNTK